MAIVITPIFMLIIVFLLPQRSKQYLDTLSESHFIVVPYILLRGFCQCLFFLLIIDKKQRKKYCQVNAR